MNNGIKHVAMNYNSIFSIWIMGGDFSDNKVYIKVFQLTSHIFYLIFSKSQKLRYKLMNKVYCFRMKV